MTLTRQGDNPKMIKHLLLPLLLTFTLLLSLSACGGGGEPTPQPQKVTVTLGLQGNAATVVGSVDVDIVLPDGFVLEMAPSGQPADTALTTLVLGATFAANYIPETTVANGEILVGIIKGDGFAGNASLVQISRNYIAGATLPTAADFIVTVVASDLTGAPLTNISGQINVNTQPVDVTPQLSH
jgi:hypothetical protein